MFLHYSAHLLVPFLFAFAAGRGRYRFALLSMLATMGVDLDHLLATPIYDPTRLSLGFHPLHSWPALGVYPFLLQDPRTRWVGVGLLWHMVTDGLDYLW